MLLKQRQRHEQEPDKPDYTFRLRGRLVPPQKNERFEARMGNTLSAASPQTIPGGPLFLHTLKLNVKTHGF